MWEIQDPSGGKYIRRWEVLKYLTQLWEKIIGKIRDPVGERYRTPLWEIRTGYGRYRSQMWEIQQPNVGGKDQIKQIWTR